MSLKRMGFPLALFIGLVQLASWTVSGMQSSTPRTSSGGVSETPVNPLSETSSAGLDQAPHFYQHVQDKALLNLFKTGEVDIWLSKEAYSSVLPAQAYLVSPNFTPNARWTREKFFTERQALSIIYYLLSSEHAHTSAEALHAEISFWYGKLTKAPFRLAALRVWLLHELTQASAPSRAGEEHQEERLRQLLDVVSERLSDIPSHPSDALFDQEHAKIVSMCMNTLRKVLGKPVDSMANDDTAGNGETIVPLNQEVTPPKLDVPALMHVLHAQVSALSKNASSIEAAQSLLKGKRMYFWVSMTFIQRQSDTMKASNFASFKAAARRQDWNDVGRYLNPSTSTFNWVGETVLDEVKYLLSKYQYSHVQSLYMAGFFPSLSEYTEILRVLLEHLDAVTSLLWPQFLRLLDLAMKSRGDDHSAQLINSPFPAQTYLLCRKLKRSSCEAFLKLRGRFTQQQALTIFRSLLAEPEIVDESLISVFHEKLSSSDLQMIALSDWLVWKLRQVEFTVTKDEVIALFNEANHRLRKIVEQELTAITEGHKQLVREAMYALLRFMIPEKEILPALSAPKTGDPMSQGLSDRLNVKYDDLARYISEHPENFKVVMEAGRLSFMTRIVFFLQRAHECSELQLDNFNRAIKLHAGSISLVEFQFLFAPLDWNGTHSGDIAESVKEIIRQNRMDLLKVIYDSGYLPNREVQEDLVRLILGRRPTQKDAEWRNMLDLVLTARACLPVDAFLLKLEDEITALNAS